MQLTENIYFYEGDYTSDTRFVYRGMGSSNFLVIKGDEQVMVDSGTTEGPHKKRVKAELRREGINLHDTRRILLSHTHPDHVMHAKTISKTSPVSFIVHRDSEPMARKSRYQLEAHYNYPEFMLDEIFNLPGWFVRMVIKRLFDFEYVRIGRMVRDHESVDIGIPADIIPIPSHFPGHIGVYFKNEKILYSADLFDFRVAEGGIINNALSSYPMVFRDIETVNSLDIEKIIPGHGRIISGRSMVRVTLDRIYSGTMDYPEKISRLISGSVSGRSITEITSSIFSDCNAYNLVARKIIVCNTLLHMRDTGRATYSIRNRRAYWRG